MWELAVGCGIVFLGAMVQGCAGFGIALVITPVLLLVLPVAYVPPIMSLLGLVNDIVVLIEARSPVSLRLLVPLLAGGLICLPLGAYLLMIASAPVIKLTVGFIVLAVAIAMLLGWRWSVRNDHWRAFPVGMLSGLLGGATSLSGPPVILFFANQGDQKNRFRANLVAYFTVLNVGSIITYWAYGLLPRQVLTQSAIYLAPLVLGTLAGVLIARRLSEQRFKRMALALILVLGITLIALNL